MIIYVNVKSRIAISVDYVVIRTSLFLNHKNLLNIKYVRRYQLEIK